MHKITLDKEIIEKLITDNLDKVLPKELLNSIKIEAISTNLDGVAIYFNSNEPSI